MKKTIGEISKNFDIHPTKFAIFSRQEKIPIFFHFHERDEGRLRRLTSKTLNGIKESSVRLNVPIPDFDVVDDWKEDVIVKTTSSTSRKILIEDFFIDENLWFLPASHVRAFYLEDFSKVLFRGKIYCVGDTTQRAVIKNWTRICDGKEKFKSRGDSLRDGYSFHSKNRKADAELYTHLIQEYLKPFFRKNPRSRAQAEIIKSKPKILMTEISKKQLREIEIFLNEKHLKK